MGICHNKLCPICSSALPGTIIENPKNSSIIVECDMCGKYAMSAEFYEDRIEHDRNACDRERLTRFLIAHKNDKLRPFLSNTVVAVASGYMNYPYFDCVLSQE